MASTLPASPLALAGALAGLSIDITLFPLDTLKTRLQSSQGFFNAGGFRGVYAGLLPAAAQSAPSAALFWYTYDSCKTLFAQFLPADTNPALIHLSAAICGEVAACTTRVPAEVVKQRMQTSSESLGAVTQYIYQQNGVRGFYRGYLPTLAREIPFSVIQFPIYEYLKSNFASWRQRPLTGWECAVVGSFSGGFAAAVTTPLDVAKTKIMLDRCSVESASVVTTLQRVFAEKGVQGLFAGILPRVMWISLGGAVFFGTFEKAKLYLNA